MEQDSGLARRGIYLLAGMAALAVVVLYMVFRPRSERTAPAPRSRPESWLALLGSFPSSAFPGNVPWAALGRSAEYLPSTPGFQVRYVATQALAVRGSAHVPLEVLREML